MVNQGKLTFIDPNCKEFGIIIMHLPLPVKSVLKTECPYSTVKIEIVSTVTNRVEHYLHLIRSILLNSLHPQSKLYIKVVDLFFYFVSIPLIYLYSHKDINKIEFNFLIFRTCMLYFFFYTFKCFYLFLYYVIKVIPETDRAHWVKCLCFCLLIYCMQKLRKVICYSKLSSNKR
jgi:hypothetical protein